MGISLQPQANVATAYRLETTFGTLATNDSSARVFRPTSGQGLKLTKAPIATQEVRADLMSQRDRHGPRSVTGTMGGELSVGTFDDLLQAVMRGTWAAPPTSGSFTLSYVQSTGILTRNSGSFLSEGFRVGDVITMAGANVTSAIGLPFVVVGVAALTLTIGNRTVFADIPSAAATTITRTKKLVMGTTRRSFSFEHWASAISNSERFTGVRVSSVTISMPASGPITVEFGFTGINMVTGTAVYFTSPVLTTSLQMVSTDAVVCYGGTAQPALQSATLSLDLNHTLPVVSGTNVSPDVIEGQAALTGSLTFFVTSQDQLTQFLNETALTLQLVFRELGTTGFVAFNVGNFTLGDYSTERIGQSDAQLVTVPIMAGIASGADRDASMLTVQASNA